MIRLTLRWVRVMQMDSCDGSTQPVSFDATLTMPSSSFLSLELALPYQTVIENANTLNNCPAELHEDLPVDSKLPQLAKEEHALLGFLCD